MITLGQALLLSINAVNLGIGLWVLIKNPRQRVNLSFFIFILGITAWSVGISLLYITHDFQYDKLALGGGLLMLFGLTFFARVFANDKPLTARFFVLFTPLIVGVACLPFNVFIRGMTVDAQGFIQPVNGPLFPFYLLLAVGYFLIGFYLFAYNFVHSTGKAKLQMRYLATGIIIFMSAVLLFNVFLPSFGIYRLNLFGPAGSVVFVTLTSYTIVRHQLMDIRVAIQRGAFYSLLVSLIVSAYVALLMVMVELFDTGERVAILVSATIITIFGIVTVPPIERYFQKVTDRFFFKNKYNYALALEKLSVVLKDNIRFSRLVPLILRSLQDILKPTFIEFAHASTGKVFDLENHTSARRAPRGMSNNGLQISIVSRKRSVGTFTFGPKRSGDPYTSEDHMLLRTFASQASVAFEKAELYQELQTYSESLEQKVGERTQRILKLQEQQRQLFDDISHALQTPLTVLKSALESMNREKIVSEKRAVECMEHSLDDLSARIRNLLQLARIDAVPMDEQKECVDIGLLVAAVIEYVEVICREKDITVRVTLEPGLIIFGNKKQIEELITNLLSNAVRYTGSCLIREISVAVRARKKDVEFALTDTGIGIAKDRLPYIFDRFYRAGDTDSASGGYGLGLAISKSIAERNAGTISVSSTYGKGTRFIVRFPRVFPGKDLVKDVANG